MLGGLGNGLGWNGESPFLGDEPVCNAVSTGADMVYRGVRVVSMADQLRPPASLWTLPQLAPWGSDVPGGPLKSGSPSCALVQCPSRATPSGHLAPSVQSHSCCPGDHACSRLAGIPCCHGRWSASAATGSSLAAHIQGVNPIRRGATAQASAPGCCPARRAGWRLLPRGWGGQRTCDVLVSGTGPWGWMVDVCRLPARVRD